MQSFSPLSHYHFHKNFPAKSFDSRIIIVIVIALGNPVHCPALAEMNILVVKCMCTTVLNNLSIHFFTDCRNSTRSI